MEFLTLRRISQTSRRHFIFLFLVGRRNSAQVLYGYIGLSQMWNQKDTLYLKDSTDSCLQCTIYLIYIMYSSISAAKLSMFDNLILLNCSNPNYDVHDTREHDKRIEICVL